MVLEDACIMLKANPQTAEGLLPLFEERNKPKHTDKDDFEELKSACGAAIVSRLLMCILASDEKKAHPRSGSSSHESSREGSDPSDSMVDLATSLAQFIEENCRGAPNTESSAPLTASDVVRYCTRLLSKSGIVTKLVFGEHSGGNGDEEIQKKLDLVVSMLNGIEQEIKSEVRLYLEFEQIWSWAAREEFLYTASLGDPKEMRGSRECAWLLQCLLSLTVCNIPEYQTDIYLLRRSLLCAAVCLLFEVMAEARDSTASNPEPASKKLKATEDAEQDAIAALSMMTNSAPPASPLLGSNSTDLGTTLNLLSDAKHLRQQFCDKVQVESGLFQSSMNLIVKFLEDQRGITKTNLGTPKVLNILRCMYRDLREDHVNPTGAMGVVNHMELYHSDVIRRCLIAQSEISVEQKASSIKNQNANVEPRKETTAFPKNKPDTVSSTKDAVENSFPNDVSSWLSRLYSDPSLAKPSLALTRHFDHSGEVALWQSITAILDRALQRLLDYVGDAFLFSSPTKGSQLKHPHGATGFPKSDSQQGGNTASVNLLRHQIQTAVLALYYHSLQSVLKNETERLGLEAHTQLLSNPALHRSLLAVGSECVMRAASLSGGTDLQFPAVLDIMEIYPDNFLTIVECFIRALCFSRSSSSVPRASPFELPFELKKHLQECETLALEKLVWESPLPNSPPFGCNEGCMQHAIDALQNYCPGPINDMLWPPLCLIDGTSTETQKLENALLRSEAMSRASSRTLQQQHMTVSFVFRKVVTLSARRILDLSELLCLDQFVTEQIWLTWKQILAEHVTLLYDRHIDQLIICTIYGVCKIARIEPELTFARIFECYYDLNPGKDRINEHIIRHIQLGRTGEQGNVIHLYNQVFVPIAKQQMWKFKYFAREQRLRTCHISDEAQLSSESLIFEAKCNFLPVRGIVHMASPSRIEKTNVYVSPFSDPSSGVNSGDLFLTEEQLSPRPRAMYAFGESSTYDLSLVNKTINYPRFPNAEVSDDDI